MAEKFPKTIKVNVNYYDHDEERNLLGYDAADVIKQMVLRPIEIPTSEFLHYYLFDRKRGNPAIYPNYHAMGQYLDDAIGEMRGFAIFNTQSVYLHPTAMNPRKPVTQYIAESVGLSIVSRFHGLTEFDWQPIPEEGERTFDYEMASTGDKIIQVESKGASADDNRVKEQNVRSQKYEMDVKKRRIKQLKEENKDPHPADIRYGTITAIDRRQDGLLQCWLTDPEPEPIGGTPERIRLLSRLKFIRDWLAFISPRSLFSMAFSTRLGCLDTIRDINELNGIQLSRINGEPFLFFDEASYFTTKSRVLGENASGVVFRLSKNELFFLGLQNTLLSIVAKQDFDTITKVKFSHITDDKKVKCVFSKSRFNEIRSIIPDSIRPEKLDENPSQYVKFELKGQLHESASGLVFGILPIPE